MKLVVYVVSTFLLCTTAVLFAQSNRSDDQSISIAAVNPTDRSRPDEVVEIDLAKIKMKYSSFNEKAFTVFAKGKEISSQLYEEPEKFVDGKVESKSKIIFVSSFTSHEKKNFVIAWKPDTVEAHHYQKATQAALGMKVDYKKVGGCYTGGRFVDVDSTTVPPDHFAHDALYRIEGPGWESDRIVYRFYLDSRNRNDIFGKKTNELVLPSIGQNDLVSDSKESYVNMLDWGMDIFKVGESLGIGSIAMWHDSKVVTVSDVGKVKCEVFNGPLNSGVMTKYLGWKVGGASYDLFSNLSISAESRLTRVDAFVNSDTVQLCTGLAKHDGCDLIESPADSKSEWAYLGLYGKQALSGDNLGIVVFYRMQDRVKLTEDGTSEIVVLRPTGGHTGYYFGAAWEQEPGGIKNEGEFKAYLDDIVLNLDNPIQTSFY